ncbi:2022_t:CDS:1, partial [Ambispora gerdemannii]
TLDETLTTNYVFPYNNNQIIISTKPRKMISLKNTTEAKRRAETALKITFILLMISLVSLFKYPKIQKIVYQKDPLVNIKIDDRSNT